MAETQGQPDSTAAPLPAPAEPQLSAAPLPDVGSSTTQPNQPAPDTTQTVDFDGMDGDAYAQLRDAYLAQPAEPAPGLPAPAPTEPATDAPEPAPANETNFEKVPDRIRLGGLSEKSRELTNLAVRLAASEGIEIGEAMARMTGPGKPADATPTEPAAPEPEPSTPEAIRERIAEMEAEEEAAANEADTVKMAQLNKAIRKAEKELNGAIAAEAQAGQSFVAAQNSSKEKARGLYPSLKDPSSPLASKWTEVFERLQAHSDPLLTSGNANLPLVISQMAAAELGLAPVDPRAAPKAAPSVPSSPSPNAVRPVQPAPGSARSSAPSNPIGQLDQRLTGITKMDDYEKLRDELFAGR